MHKTYVTEILSVGTELLLGHVTNTDARDIAEQLSKIGIDVRWQTVVGDNPQRLRDCVEIAKGRADIIVTTGGLGPTCDDLTKQILAESFGLRLVKDEAEYAGIYDYFNVKKNFTPNNYLQAYLPEGCTVFHNNCGTAPGCAFEAQGKTVVMLPGPPKECNAMFRDSAVPYLKKLSGGRIVSHTLNIFGLGESSIDQMFRDEMNAMKNPSMAPYAKECDCLLKVTAKAGTAEEAEEMLRPAIAEIREKLGDIVYGMDVDCLEEAVMQLLRDRPLTFAAAESCTGGDIARRFTDLPGASAFFLGGVVSYTNGVKAGVLGIDPALIEEKTAVSYEVAKEMAENVRRLTGADVGLGVTGLAGPDGDGVHEVGTVFISLSDGVRTWVREAHMGAHRTRSYVRRMAGNYAFDMLRRYMTGLDVLG